MNSCTVCPREASKNQSSPYDPERIRAEFPLLAGGGAPDVPLVYLDSAATSQKPGCVIDAVTQYLAAHNANVHRGAYPLAEDSTALYERSREVVARFIGAQEGRNIVFTHGSTESLNMIALGWGGHRLRAGDSVLITEAEHHANIVPWQMLAKAIGIEVKYLPVDPTGAFDIGRYEDLLEQEPKIVSFSGMSNVTGYIPPQKKMIELAHSAGARTVVDASQLVAHQAIDVSDLGVDFLAFSGHKLYAPTGIGVLYGSTGALEEMEPVFGGGEMISQVTLDGSGYAAIPARFEAGTPAIAEAVGLGVAIEYLQGLGMPKIDDYERGLYEYALKRLLAIPGLTVLGYPDASVRACDARAALFSLAVKGVHPHDLEHVLGSRGICVRGGHHCAMPLHRALGVPASLRASFGVYTTKAEVDFFASALEEASRILA